MRPINQSNAVSTSSSTAGPSSPSSSSSVFPAPAGASSAPLPPPPHLVQRPWLSSAPPAVPVLATPPSFVAPTSSFPRTHLAPPARHPLTGRALLWEHESSGPVPVTVPVAAPSTFGTRITAAPFSDTFTASQPLGVTPSSAFASHIGHPLSALAGPSTSTSSNSSIGSSSSSTACVTDGRAPTPLGPPWNTSRPSPPVTTAASASRSYTPAQQQVIREWARLVSVPPLLLREDVQAVIRAAAARLEAEHSSFLPPPPDALPFVFPIRPDSPLPRVAGNHFPSTDPSAKAAKPLRSSARFRPPRSRASAMSLAYGGTDYLSHSVAIEFETGSIDMVGTQSTGSGYSLAGHVRITTQPFLDTSPCKRQLTELYVDVEGSAEYFDKDGNYTPFRIYRKRFHILTATQPLLIPSLGPPGSYSFDPIQVAIPFDLHIPGWLPATMQSKVTRVLYGAVATSRIGWVNGIRPQVHRPVHQIPHNPVTPSRRTHTLLAQRDQQAPLHVDTRAISNWLATTALGPTAESATSLWTEFAIHRHRLPIAMGIVPDRVERHYTLSPDKDSHSPVECIVSLPDWVDVNAPEKSIKISMRIRARKREPMLTSSAPAGPSAAMPDTRGAQSVTGHDSHIPSCPLSRFSGVEPEAVPPPDTHLIELGMEIEENERFYSTVQSQFTAHYPVPAEQPSRYSSEHALMGPTYPFTGVPSGQKPRSPTKGTNFRSCLLADDGTQRNFFFADGGLPLGDKWRKVNIALPMPNDTERQRANKPVSDLDGPFVRIKHCLKIKIVCKEPSNKTGTSTVVILSAPIKFGSQPAESPERRSLPPPYISVYYENGEVRDCDPLPLYTKGDEDEEEPMLESTTYQTTQPVPILEVPPASATSLLTAAMQAHGSSTQGDLAVDRLIPTATSGSFLDSTPASSAMSRSTSGGFPTAAELIVPPHMDNGPLTAPSALDTGTRGGFLSDTLSDILRDLETPLLEDRSAGAGASWGNSAQAAPDVALASETSSEAGMEPDLDGDTSMEPADDEVDGRPAVRRRTQSATCAPSASSLRAHRSWRRYRASATGLAGPRIPPALRKVPSAQSAQFSGMEGDASSSAQPPHA